tara:strand:+ start:623 stop:922 length:300 start_codon:yes stop_codon:yes gene_type:complete
MNRVTLDDINVVLNRLNDLAGAEREPYTVHREGNKIHSYTKNKGTFLLYCAYGSFGLDRFAEDTGGQATVLNLGTKKELYNGIQNIITGINLTSKTTAR